MTFEYLYEYAKQALKFFCLDWNEKDKMIMSFKKDEIIFSYLNETIILKVEAE